MKPLPNIQLPEPRAAKAKDLRRAGRAHGVAYANHFQEMLKPKDDLTPDQQAVLNKGIANDIAATANALRAAGYSADQVAIFENCMKAGFKSRPFAPES